MNLKTSLLKDKKTTSEKLRIENKQMEIRLQQLKLAMVKEKEERLSSGNKSNWSTGTPGALLNYKPTISTIDSGKKIRLKMLKQETLPSVVRTTNLKSNILRDVMDGDTLLPKSDINIELNSFGKNMSVRSCGQCEDIQAAVNCKECAEDYCPKCFAAFHLKGALRKHRSTPISTLSNRVSIPSPLFKPPDFKNISNSSQSKIPSSRNLEKKSKVSVLEDYVNKEPVESSKENLSPKVNDSSLAEGEYNEEVSNQYFQEAMNAWRNGIDLSTKLPILQKTSTIEHSTETLSNNQDKNKLSNLIQFTPSLTYAEQLLLRKHRNNQLAPVDMKYILERLAKTNEVELLENQKLLQSNLILETSLINSNTEKALNNDPYRVDFNSVNKLLNDAEQITGRYSSMSTRKILQSPFKIEEIPSYCERIEINNSSPEKIELEIEEIEKEQGNTKSDVSSDSINQNNNGNKEIVRTISDIQRPKSAINRNNFYDKPSAARRKSARHQRGGKLTSEPSVLLNILANFSIYLPDNFNSSSLNLLSSKRPSSADVSLSNNKISYNFYKMTPNSWKPAQAWSDELLERKSIEKCAENSLSPIENEDEEIEEELTKLNLLSSQAKKDITKHIPFSDGMSSHKSSENERNDPSLLSDVDGDCYDEESEKNEIFDQLDTLERELTVLSKQEQIAQENNYDEMLIDSLDITNDNACLNSIDSDKFCFEDSLDFQQRYSANSNAVHENYNVDEDDEESLVNCSSRFDDYEDVYKLN